jgi:hypothetical protein
VIARSDFLPVTPRRRTHYPNFIKRPEQLDIENEFE